MGLKPLIHYLFLKQLFIENSRVRGFQLASKSSAGDCV